MVSDGVGTKMTRRFHQVSALSAEQGESRAAQDLHWLAQNIPCQAADRKSVV